MADIKTHLRELSVATTIGLLLKGEPFKKEDLYDPQNFYNLAKSVIHNNISSAKNIIVPNGYTNDLKNIIDNGYKLGKKIYKTPYFKFKSSDKIEWLGNDTQKESPEDISIGNYGFSLKEDSFILENMGLYKLLNILTGSSYKRGLHAFQEFAKSEYDEWFLWTWKSLIKFLEKNGKWELRKNGNISKITLSNTNVILSYNSKEKKIPKDVTSCKEFNKKSSSVIREKVFAKWIKYVIKDNEEYLKKKKKCAKAAGEKIAGIINDNYESDNIFKFFRIYRKEYYYAKTTDSETTILRVPSIKEFSNCVEFVNCSTSVPDSQLNIITTFKNIKTKKMFQIENQCRFSHGQFNGSPEAKMYYKKDEALDIYETLD